MTDVVSPTVASQALIDDMAKIDGDILVLGAGGKMGPDLVRLALDALRRCGSAGRVVAVSRFGDPTVANSLAQAGAHVVPCDLTEREAWSALPDAANVVYMVGRKFGTSDRPSETWWINSQPPIYAVERFADSRIAAFSTGQVYGPVSVLSGGATIDTPVRPVGEYGQATLARERLFEHVATARGTRVILLRLNYAVTERYGVLVDIAKSLLSGSPIDVRAAAVNVCWQGWANEVALRSLPLATNPPRVLNMTGPETLPITYIATELARRLGVEATFIGEPSSTTLLNNAAESHRLFGYPAVSVDELLDITADHLLSGGATLNKPTHFDAVDGAF